jgi:hypothetical protein
VRADLHGGDRPGRAGRLVGIVGTGGETEGGEQERTMEREPRHGAKLERSAAKREVVATGGAALLCTLGEVTHASRDHGAGRLLPKSAT